MCQPARFPLSVMVLFSGLAGLSGVASGQVVPDGDAVPPGLAVVGSVPDGAVAQEAVQQPTPPTTYPEIRKLYEAGKYQQVVDAVAAVQPPTPPLHYLAGLAHEKLQQPARANDRYGRLAKAGTTTATPEGAAPESGTTPTDPWHFIGQSATSLNQAPKKIDEAVAAARKAVELAPQNVHAQYQLGLALGNQRDYAGAAQAFEKATEIDPAHAYAHYHAGLSYYQVKRIDQVARHFEAFLQLAPEAPERGQVMSIMRTIRG